MLKRERLIDDQAAFLPIAEPDFESRRVVPSQADSLSLVTFDGNQYSVPAQYAHRRGIVVAGIEELKIIFEDQLLARHLAFLLQLSEPELLERERKAAERRLEAAQFRHPKTHLATVLGVAACQQGYKVRFFRVTELITPLLEVREDKELTTVQETVVMSGSAYP